ncbi:MAG: SdrD B-like domain-containing protein [Fervidicoccaceae archaeon]
MNNSKIWFFLLLFIGSILTAAMAMWGESLKVNTSVNTGELDIRFVPGSVITSDPCGSFPGYDWNATYYPNAGATQLDKNVGCTAIQLIDSDGDGDHDTLNMVIYNAYPWYYAHTAFKVENDGTIPLKIWRVGINGNYYYAIDGSELLDLNNDGLPDVSIWWGDNFGVQLHPGNSADLSFDVVVLQSAPMGSTLIINITIEAVQWNEYQVPPSVQGGSLSGYVYHDANENQIYDPIEDPLQGIALQLLNSANALIATTVTNSLGFYSFGNLPSGNYIIKVMPPAGYTNTTYTEIVVSLSSGENKINLNFGMKPFPSLSISKDFRHTDVNWKTTGWYLGTPLDMKDGNYIVNVTLDKNGKIKSSVPGVFYGLLNITGSGIFSINVTDVFEDHFDVKVSHGNADIHVFVLKGSNLNEITNSSIIYLNNNNNTAKISLILGTPLSSGDSVLIYLKFEMSDWLDGQEYSSVDKYFTNNATLITNIGSASASATIYLQQHQEK